MQRLMAVACGLCAWLVLVGPSSAQDDECRAVIAKAMKAVGGEEKLATLKNSHIKSKGTINTQGVDFEVTAEIFSQEPDKQKIVVDFSFMNMNFTLVRVVTGNKGWQSLNDKSNPLTAQELEESREGMNSERVTGLVALKDKEYKLSPLGEVKVGEHQTIGILVSRKGYRDVSLYFDKNSYLMVKTETRSRDPNSMQEANQEKLLSDYKELVPGMRVPSKMVINYDGKKFMDMTITEVRPVEKHDASIFAKP